VSKSTPQSSKSRQHRDGPEVREQIEREVRGGAGRREDEITQRRQDAGRDECIPDPGRAHGVPKEGDGQQHGAKGPRQ
jgi:hypothetical protein